MKPHRTVLVGVLGLALTLVGSAVAVAQDTPLEVLRIWIGHTDEASRYIQKGNYARAEERLTLAIKELRPYYPKTRRIMARTYCELARVYYYQKRFDEAEKLAKWALSVREADKDSSPDAVFQCVYALGAIEAALEHYGEAEPLLQRALEFQEKHLGPDHINTALVLTQLASVYVQQDKLADAEPLYARAIAIQERQGTDENLALADTGQRYALLLRRLKRYDEAERWNSRAAAIRDTVATKAAKAKANRPRKDFQGFN
jgi:tetratricopeptide (TPR) repeat protein